MKNFRNFTYNKLKDKVWDMIVKQTKRKRIYYMLYKSFWHYKLFPKKQFAKNCNYFTAIPHKGAGIGHQIANWIAGYWFAKQLGLRFAHTPFASEKWEIFLGFGENEICVQDLLETKDYAKVKIPLFDEYKPLELKFIKNIINSYANKKVLFVAEQDQFYADQFGVMPEIKKKFYNAKARSFDELLYSNINFNIAVHVRRGDIVPKKGHTMQNITMRWQDNAYFINVLKTVIGNLKVSRPIFVHVFSQGIEDDFKEFNDLTNTKLCLDMNAQDSFLHMARADLLITSKSSFSYKPALLNNGIKIVPSDFWHSYPTGVDWIQADEEGNFDFRKLSANLLIHE